MSDDNIKGLVERLDEHWGRRRIGDMSSLFADAADALEALVAERDRMRSALETIAEGRDSGRHDGLPEEHPAHSAVLMHYIACEALEGREWERFRNEKVGTHGTPELDDDARKLEAMGQDPGATFATDPAPVCEWTRTPWGPSPSASPLDALYIPRCNADYLCSVPDSGVCRRCGLPIKFKEDKE